MATVFVFYDIAESGSWKYPTSMFPARWGWTGAGGTGSSKYPREEQFNGPLSSRAAMRRRLDAKFKSLRNKGVVRRYAIRSRYNVPK